MAKTRAGFTDDAVDKLKEIGWFVLMGLLRWLIDRLTQGNPGSGGQDVEGEPER